MAQSKNGYIPAGVQRAMDQHMQRMPANLQKYQSGGYIPAKAAKSMESYMQKSMPGHMKEYITPYMHQKTVAGLNSLDPVRSRTIQAPAPSPNLMRRDHSGIGAQFTVNVQSSASPTTRKSLSFSPQYSTRSGEAPPAPPPAPLPNGNANPYDFIMNSGGSPKKGLTSKPSGGSITQRIIVVAVGALLLLIVLIVLLSVVFKSSGGSAAQLTDLAQQQTEIARVADLGVNQATSATTKNFALTTKFSMLSSQQQTLALLSKKGHKLGVKSLALKQNSVTDQQLTAAAANSAFDATFTKLLTDELASYRTSLQTDYKSATGDSEKQLLQSGFTGVTLLIGDNQGS